MATLKSCSWTSRPRDDERLSCALRCAQHVVGLGTDAAGPIFSKEFEAPRGLLNKC